MEGRQLLCTMTFQVTNALDNGDESRPIANSLRWAVVQANKLSGTGNTAEIDFNIAGANGQAQQISLQAPLAPIGVPTFFNGTTESGYSSQAAIPLVNIDGTYAPSGSVGLDFTALASNSKVTGLAVSGFSGGILLDSASNVTLGRDWVGVDEFRTSEGQTQFGVDPNTSYGIRLTHGAYHNTLDSDVVSANATDGVQFIGASTQNTVSSSLIGTDPTGTQGSLTNGFSLGNGGQSHYGTGLLIASGATNNVVRNDVISDNGTYGVLIGDSGTNYNTLFGGNKIGTDASGSYALPNPTGVAIIGGAQYNNVGSTLSPDLISGNSGVGVQITGASTQYDYVQGERIGTDATGTKPLGNQTGILIGGGSSSDIVGGYGASYRNLVSGNRGNGIQVDGSGSSYHAIIGDYAGTDVSASYAVPNGGSGVAFTAGAFGNSVLAGVLSGNVGDGLLVDNSTSNRVYSNIVGLSADGSHAVANHFGIQVQYNSNSNAIGLGVGNGNVISGNAWDGLQLNYVSNVTVQGNMIGTDPTGSYARPNAGSGVAIYGGSINNTVGGTSASSRNIISGNGYDGVYVIDSGTNSNTVQFDYIGTDVTGEKPVSNGTNGVILQAGASYNNIYNDLISANGNDGVLVTGGNTSNNTLTGDWIGLDGTGTRALLHSGSNVSNATGVAITSGAYNTSVGNDFISGNNIGVLIAQGATSNWVVYDHIGTDVAGTGNVGNANDGVILDNAYNNLVGYDTLAWNGDVGILGEDGSNASNNSIVSDTYTVTVGGQLYGNKNGTTDFC